MRLLILAFTDRARVRVVIVLARETGAVASPPIDIPVAIRTVGDPRALSRRQLDGRAVRRSPEPRPSEGDAVDEMTAVCGDLVPAAESASPEVVREKWPDPGSTSQLV